MRRWPCVALGCTNPVVREMEHKTQAGLGFGLCALHVRRGLKYMTTEQQRRVVFPFDFSFDVEEPAAPQEQP